MQMLLVAFMALAAYTAVRLWSGEQPVHALPEFAERTGEPCATCHVNPGGGGPRTLRGLLWAARGRPDVVPELSNALLAPGVADGGELYDIACAGCHGLRGEGLFAINLAERDISPPALRRFIHNGIPELGMPSFEGKFTEEQLDALVQYVRQLGEGQVPPHEYPLPPPEFRCEMTITPACGGE
jgi:mono/diheme cytochrome c family protein